MKGMTNMFKSKYKLIKIAAALLLAVSLSACGVAGTGAPAPAEEAAAGGDMFTSRDKETGWDESQAVSVTLSDAGSVASGAGVTVSGGTVTVTEEGTYLLSGVLSEGQVIVDAGKDDKVQLVLKNADIACASAAPLYVKSADKVFVTLAAGSENTLIHSGAFAAADENNVDGCVFSKEDITFNGDGTLNIACAQGHGIVSKDSLRITGGVIQIQAEGHGIQGKDDIRILSGTLNVVSAKDGLHAENDADDELGFIYIEGGSLNINAGDDGLHAGSCLTVENGEINIVKSYEGIEAKKITIDGGEIRVTAEDDGMNAASGASGSGYDNRGVFSGGSADCDLTINGGVIYVNAGGDGVDSNGTLNITGGEIYVWGPTNAGNGAMDYETQGEISGGTVVAVGAAGMAVNFSRSSAQCAALLSLSGSGGETVTLKDASGKTLLSFTPEKAYQCILISTPDLKVGETYTLSAQSASKSFTLTSALYSETGVSGGFGGQQPGVSDRRGS